MILINFHSSEHTEILTLCDSDLIGKKFEEGDRQLDVRENFYKGEEFSEEKVAALMKNERADDSTFNIIGKRAVDLALSSGIISDGNVGNVGGIPFALVLL